MATLRKRSDKWQVQVRRRGQKPLTRTFENRTDAQKWARYQERLADLGAVADDGLFASPNLGVLIDRYIAEICPLKRSAGSYEAIILGAFRRRSAKLVRSPAGDLRSSDFIAYRNARLKQVSGETLRRELGILQHLFETARSEWGLPLANPLKELRKPVRNLPRERRLGPDERTMLIQALESCRNPLMMPLVLLALETGMRRGELLSIRWRDVDEQHGVIHVRRTKNGQSRRIPLTGRGLDLIRSVRMIRSEPGDLIFPLSAVAVRQAWDRLTRRAGIVDLHFHDLRHEAISGFFEKGLSLPEVAMISGHRDPRQLMRYTHLDAIRIARKLQNGDGNDLEI